MHISPNALFRAYFPFSQYAAKLLVVQLYGGEQIQVFQQQDCFAGDSIMTMTYPFPVSGDEFKGKRVLVTGGTKGMGQAMVRRFTLSGASVATTARSPLPDGQAVALFVQTDIGKAAGVQNGIRRLSQEMNGIGIPGHKDG